MESWLSAGDGLFTVHGHWRDAATVQEQPTRRQVDQDSESGRTGLMMGFPSGPVFAGGGSTSLRDASGSLSDFTIGSRWLFRGSSLKTTRPFRGRLRTALAQSVGAGCCDAGTLSNQIRHMPDGGRCVRGT